MEVKKALKRLAPFLADHNGSTPYFGTKLRWARTVWNEWALTRPPEKGPQNRSGTDA